MDIEATIQRLTKALRGTGTDEAGIRIRARYQPAGGKGSKLHPPTYPLSSTEGHRYLVEKRWHEDGSPDDAPVDVVLVSSPQGEANVVEETIQEAIDAGEIHLPHLELELDTGGRKRVITNLTAPHRGADAYFRDAQMPDGTAFDETEAGEALRRSDERSARACYEYTPTDLVFGHWDSHRGGRGRRIPRAYSSEAVGWHAEIGKSAAVRVDPENIQKGPKVAYDKDDPADWEFIDGEDAPKDLKSGDPSNIGHGNAISTYDAREQDKRRGAVGVSVSHVERTAFVSFAALRRLRFPENGERTDPDVDAGARAVLAALALLGDRLAFGGSSIFYRSGCDLVRESEVIEWIMPDGQEPLTLSREDALELFRAAVAKAEELGLSFAAPISLEPKKKLQKLLDASYELAVEEEELAGQGQE